MDATRSSGLPGRGGRARRVFVMLLSILAIVACGDRSERAAEPDATFGVERGTPMDTTPAGTPAPPAGAAAAAAAPSSLDAELREWAIRLSQPTTAPGPVTFRITNAGTLRHEFEIEGPGVEQQVYLEPGESTELDVDLRPGRYEIKCELETDGVGHDERGMRAELVIG